MKTPLALAGFLEVEARNVRTGEVRRERIPNKITNGGLTVFRNLLLGTARLPRAIAAGTDDGTLLGLSATNTALGAEVVRKALNRRDAATNKARFQILLDTTEANGNTLREAGLTDNPIASAATLIARTFHTSINKTNLIQVTYTWEIVVSEVV